MTVVVVVASGEAVEFCVVADLVALLIGLSSPADVEVTLVVL